MIAAIHQPECFPWLGFIDKAARADTFIVLDDVQFRKNYFQNRNKVLTSAGPSWITIPILKSKTSSKLIKDMKIDEQSNPRWRKKHFAAWEQSYTSSPHAAKYMPFLKTLYEKEWASLVDFNMAVIQFLFKTFEVSANIVLASSLDSTEGTTEKLVSLCKQTGASEYLSGISGKEYLDESLFEAAGIPILYQEFYHPIYRQRGKEFVPLMPAFDMLFNEGPASAQMLKDASTKRMDTVFL